MVSISFTIHFKAVNVEDNYKSYILWEQENLIAETSVCSAHTAVQRIKALQTGFYTEIFVWIR